MQDRVEEFTICALVRVDDEEWIVFFTMGFVLK